MGGASTTSPVLHWVLAVTVEVDAGPHAPPPPPGVARALDECLNNSVVHGCATTVAVRIGHTPDGWEIEVAGTGDGPAGGAPGGLIYPCAISAAAATAFTVPWASMVASMPRLR